MLLPFLCAVFAGLAREFCVAEPVSHGRRESRRSRPHCLIVGDDVRSRISGFRQGGFKKAERRFSNRLKRNNLATL